MFFNCFYIVYSTAFLRFLISSLISLYSLDTLFTETNSSWLIATPIGTPTNEANAEIETQPLTAETKQENSQSNLKPYTFSAFHSWNHYVLFLLN